MLKRHLIILILTTNISSTKDDNTYYLKEPFITVSSGVNDSLEHCGEFYSNIDIKLNIKGFLESESLPMDIVPQHTFLSFNLKDFDLTEEAVGIYNGEEKTGNSIIWNVFNAPDELTLTLKLEKKVINLFGPEPQIVTLLWLGDSGIEANTHLNIKNTSFGKFEYFFTNNNAYGEGCLKLSVQSKCLKFNPDDYIIFKTNNYGENHYMLEKKICNIEMQASNYFYKDVCSYEERSVKIRDIFFPEQDYSTIIFQICDLINPPNFWPDPNMDDDFKFSIYSNKDVELISSRYLFTTNYPIKIKTKKIELTNNIVNSNFELSIDLDFETIYFLVRNFDIKIFLPPEYNYIVKKISVEVTNNMTKKNVLFSDIPLTDIFFKINLPAEEIDPKSGFVIKITNFNIPDVLGDLKIKFQILDNKTQNFIVEKFEYDFSIFPNLDQDFHVNFKSEMDVFTNCKMSSIILHKNYHLDLIDIKLFFNDVFEIKKKEFKGIINNNLTFSNFQIDEINNTLLINKIKINKFDEKTFFEFNLQNLKTKFINTKNLEIKLLALNGDEEIFKQSKYINLEPISINIKNLAVVIIENNEKSNKKRFKIKFVISSNKFITFNHYLRINLPKTFIIENNTDCVASTDLPNYSKSDFKCIFGFNKKNDNEKFLQNILFENILKNALTTQSYELEIEGYLEDYVNRNYRLFFDVLPMIENSQDFEYYQLQNEKVISNYVVENLIFECPLSCTKCEVSLQNLLQCYECDPNLKVEIDYEKNICKKIEIDNNPDDQNQNAIKNTQRYKNIIFKIFTAFFFSFLFFGLIISVYLKFLYKHIFLELVFFASFYSFVHFLLTYLLFAYSLLVLNSTLLVLIIVFVLIFVLANIIFTLGSFARGVNKVMENVKIFGFSSTHGLFIFFYCLFGSGISLWVGIFQFSNIYSKLLIDDFHFKKFKTIYKIVLYFNLLSVLSLTLGISAVFFAFTQDSNVIIYFYIVSGFFVCFFHFILIVKDKKRFEFSNTAFASTSFNNENNFNFFIDQNFKNLDMDNTVSLDNIDFGKHQENKVLKNFFTKLKSFNSSLDSQ